MKLRWSTEMRLPSPSRGCRSLVHLSVVVIAACATPRAGGNREVEPIAALPAGWNQIDGGAGTACALGTPYSFFARPGNPDKLMVYFEGGGACWNGETCDVRGRPSFDPQVDSTDHPSRWRGLFDFTRDDNPVKDYTIVVVTYCTGDTFLNDRARTYTSGPRSREPNRTFEIKHIGALDAQYVLDWTYAHVRHPGRVFVTGSSAGAIPSPLYAVQVAKRYPKANVVQLGDAAGGYRSAEVAPNLFRSGAAERLRRDRAYRGVDSASLNFEMLYIVSAREAPRASFAQYNNVEDSVQAGFLRALGEERVDLAPLLRANLSDIRRAVPRLRSYTAPGAMHTILQRPQFYTMTVDGTPFRDWLAAQLDGKRVDNVGESLLRRGTP